MSNPENTRPTEHPPEQTPPATISEETGHRHGATDTAQLERQRLAQESARHAKTRRSTLVDKLIRAVVYLVTALEVLLGLRFILRITGANPDNMFASFILGLSDPFVAPFSTLFVSPTFNGNRYIFDVNLLVAMAAYLALLALFLGLVKVFYER